MLDLESQAWICMFTADTACEDMWFTDACEYLNVQNNPFYGGTSNSGGIKKSKSSANTSTSTTSGSGGGAATAGSPDLLFVARSDGYVSLIDFRMSSGSGSRKAPATTANRASSGSSSRIGYAWTCDMGYKVQSVQHWPTNENLILTANAGSGESLGTSAGTMNVWDMRYLTAASTTSSSSGSSGSSSGGSKGQKLPAAVVAFAGHAKSVNAAYASPDGQYVLSVSQDNTIRCWGVQEAVEEMAGDYEANASSSSSSSSSGTAGRKSPVKSKAASSGRGQTILFSSKAHDNHTGRWLSTFRPLWDPKAPHSFFLGSMSKPRCLESFNVTSSGSGSGSSSGSGGISISSALCLLSEPLASVVSRNAVHPTLNIVAAGNSSGRVHVFR